jgi:hypothetical protein
MASEEKVAELQEQLQRMRIEQVTNHAEAECMGCHDLHSAPQSAACRTWLPVESTNQSSQSVS